MELVKMQRYESYKDSGVEWLSLIPKNWQTIKMKFLYRDFSVKNKPTETLLSVTQDKGVIPRDWVESRMVMPSGNLESFKFIEKGDFAISLRSFEGGLEYCHHNGIVSPAYTVLKSNNPTLNAGYYKYLFKSQAFISELQTSIVGIREGKNISYEELRYSLLPIPLHQEQTAIANFLDQKTAQIDEAIAIKEQQIELLKERKQIIIQKAVTQGLNPNVTMKDSGVEWIGMVPEHWEVKRIKHIGKIINGYAFPSEDFRESGVKVMKISNIQTMNVDWSDSSYVDEFWLKKCKQFQVFKNDLVFALTRPIISTGIKAAIINTDEPILLNQRNAVFRPNQMCAINWLYYIILNRDFISTFEMKIDITGQQPNISTVSISNLSIPVPPRHEQLTLCEFIDERCKEIDSLISGAVSQIEKLKEYKTTLINSAVTGKIRVA